MEVQSLAHIFKNKIIVTSSKMLKCGARHTERKLKESNATACDVLGVYVLFVQCILCTACSMYICCLSGWHQLLYEPVFGNVYGPQKSIPPGWESIPGLPKRSTNTGSHSSSQQGERPRNSKHTPTSLMSQNPCQQTQGRTTSTLSSLS
jgi:hypothetical protein